MTDSGDGVVLTVPFLGERRYIQGPSILAALSASIPPSAAVAFKVKRVVASDRMRVHPLDDAEAEKRCSAFLTCDAAGRRISLGVEPLPPSEPGLRIPYDEEAIWSRTTFEASAASLDQAEPHDFVTAATSINKALLLRTLPQDGAGRWMFVATQLRSLPESGGRVRVEVAQHMPSFRLVRSHLLANGEPVGSLDFVWSPA